MYEKTMVLKLFQKKYLFDHLKKHDENFNDIERIKFSEHHYSHAASAFFPSPFKDSIILTLDGVGEWATTTVAIGKGNKLQINHGKSKYEPLSYWSAFKIELFFTHLAL